MNQKIIAGVAGLILAAPITTLVNNQAEVVYAKNTKWHNGIPKLLWGDWRGHGVILKLSKKQVHFIPENGADENKTKKVVYRQTGKSKYQYKASWAEGGTYKGNIKYLNHNHIKFNGYTLKKENK